MAPSPDTTHSAVKPEAKHVAAAVFQDRPIVGGLIPEFEEARRIRATARGRQMYEAVSTGQETVEEPVFSNIDRTVQSRAEEETALRAKAGLLQAADPRRQLLENQANSVHAIAERLAANKIILQEIYQGGQLSDDTLKAVGKILALSPNFYTPVALGLNVDPDLIKTALENGNFLAMVNVKASIEAHLKDEGMKRRLAKFFTENKYDENIDSLDTQITNLESQIDTNRQNIDAKRQKYNAAKVWYTALPQAQRQALETALTSYRNLVSTLTSPQDPSLRLQTVDITGLDALDAALNLQIPILTANQQIGNNAQKLIEVTTCQAKVGQLRALLGQPIFQPQVVLGNQSEIDMLQDAKAADQKLAELVTETRQLTTDSNTLTNCRQQRLRALEKYETGVNRTLEKTVKGYLNEVILADSARTAIAEAEEKTEKETTKRTEKEQKEAKLTTLLGKFLRLSMFKYENGQIVGWEDDFIKTAIKEDILKNSPDEMVRILLRKVYDKRAEIPPKYIDEINQLFVDLGLPQGAAPAQVEAFFNSLDKGTLDKLAPEAVSKLLGYGWARGYFFDRLRFKKHQKEFLQVAYGEDFFTNALRHKTDFKTNAEKELKDVLTAGAEIEQKLKSGLAGGNAWELMKRLFKLLAILGVVGVVGGGVLVGGKAAFGAAGHLLAR